LTGGWAGKSFPALELSSTFPSWLSRKVWHDAWVMFRYDVAVAGNFHKKRHSAWLAATASPFFFVSLSALLKPKVPVMASRNLWDFYPFYLGRFANLMLTVMPDWFSITFCPECQENPDLLLCNLRDCRPVFRR
jgi:hypothetical protein